CLHAVLCHVTVCRSFSALFPYTTLFRSEIVVLNSWGQWCAPCRAEVDDLQRVQEELDERDLGTVLGINVRDYNPQIARDLWVVRSEEHTSELQSRFDLVCRLLLEKKTQK